MWSRETTTYRSDPPHPPAAHSRRLHGRAWLLRSGPVLLSDAFKRPQPFPGLVDELGPAPAPEPPDPGAIRASVRHRAAAATRAGLPQGIQQGAGGLGLMAGQVSGPAEEEEAPEAVGLRLGFPSKRSGGEPWGGKGRQGREGKRCMRPWHTPRHHPALCCGRMGRCLPLLPQATW